jgi:hypothetical protein
MGTSIALAIMAARQHSPSGSILDQIPVESAPPPSTQPATPSGPAKPAPPAEPTVPLAK